MNELVYYIEHGLENGKFYLELSDPCGNHVHHLQSLGHHIFIIEPDPINTQACEDHFTEAGVKESCSSKNFIFIFLKLYNR